MATHLELELLPSAMPNARRATFRRSTAAAHLAVRVYSVNHMHVYSY